MGQEITVTARAGASPTVRIFDCNRSITGMAIESYTSLEDTAGGRPPDVLARRLFDLGATRVTVYSSAVTVEAIADLLDRVATHELRNPPVPGDDVVHERAHRPPVADGLEVPLVVTDPPDQTVGRIERPSVHERQVDIHDGSLLRRTVAPEVAAARANTDVP